MKKTFKDLFKLATALATVAGIAYVARDQIKAIIDKVKEVSGDDIDDDFDEDSFDDDSFDEEEIFHEPTKDDRDYVQSISQKAMIVQTKKMKQGKLHLQKTKSNII